ALDTVRMATSLLQLGFTGDGALVSALLPAYEAFGEDVPEGQPVQLAPEGGRLLEPMLVMGQGGQGTRIPLRLEASDDSAGLRRLRFAWRSGGREAVLTYTLGEDSYTLHATLLTRGLAEAPQLSSGCRRHCAPMKPTRTRTGAPSPT